MGQRSRAGPSRTAAVPVSARYAPVADPHRLPRAAGAGPPATDRGGPDPGPPAPRATAWRPRPPRARWRDHRQPRGARTPPLRRPGATPARRPTAVARAAPEDQPVRTRSEHAPASREPDG